jgi:putative ABC transport system ATP-binding protein
MVTHDVFSASYCKRILFLKDGEIFHELIRGKKGRKEFLNEIFDVLALTGGEQSPEPKPAKAERGESTDAE